MSCGRRLVPWIAGAMALMLAPEVAAQVQIGGLSDLQLGSGADLATSKASSITAFAAPRVDGTPSRLEAWEQAARSCC